MKITRVKASDYNSVNEVNLYDYIRDYASRIFEAVEPLEDGTGNSYKHKREEFSKCNRTELKAIAADLETVHKRLEYILHGRY